MKIKKATEKALFQLGFTQWEYGSKDWDAPSITIQERLNAICEHLGIFIVKNPSAIVIEEITLPRRSKK